jgi:hypothetical protein
MVMHEKLLNALAVLDLPVLISLKEVRSRYRSLAKKHHPDISNDKEKMQRINEAYKLVITYMETYKFTFSEEEVAKQFPEESHATRFRF